MIEETLEWQRWLVAMSLTMPRITAMFSLMPLFSRQVLPGLTRNAFAMSLAIVVVPVVEATMPAELDIPFIIGLALKETVIGLVLGYSVTILLWTVESVGFFIDNQRGAAMASSMNPLTGEQASPLGILLTQAVTAIFFVGGGILAFLSGLYESYQVWPVMSYMPVIDLNVAEFFLAQLDMLTYLTVFLAGPVVLVMFMAEFGLALVSRFAPQLNVFFLAMPIKSAVGGFLLILYATTLIGYFAEELRALEWRFQEIFQLLGVAGP